MTYGYMTEYTGVSGEHRVVFYDYFFGRRIHAEVLTSAPADGRLMASFRYKGSEYDLYHVRRERNESFNYAVVIRSLRRYI